MKTAFVSFVLSLATLALAQGPARFTLVTASANNDIHNKEVVALNQHLWINRTTASYCPAQVGAACPAGTITSFAGGQGTLGMNVMVPGGQQVYVNATGSIKFTQAHSAGMDPNSTTIIFEYHPNIVDGYGQLALNGQHGFLACPFGDEGARAIKAIMSDAVPTGCDVVHLLVPESITIEGATAWQYT